MIITKDRWVARRTDIWSNVSDYNNNKKNSDIARKQENNMQPNLLHRLYQALITIRKLPNNFF